MTNLPIVCTLTPAALKARREGALTDLLRRAEAHDELPQGHRLQFGATDDMLATIAQTIDAERQCCWFLRFSITVEPDGGPISLELTGPPGTRTFADEATFWAAALRGASCDLRTRNAFARRDLYRICGFSFLWLGVRDDFRNWLLSAA